MFYIKILKYPYLTPVFQLNNIYLEFFTCPLKFKWFCLCHKLFLNAVYEDFDTNIIINNHQICFEKVKTTQSLVLYTYLSSFYNKSDVKISNYC